ncbi:hypothetical protein NXX31_08970 [Bacteroides thetaiotaomicron]|jgi:hypothetical protein|uniref:hypothetical protein n=1 Tax=Bacteroides thetaiotaomicron TaxID=818 RepID=UPI000AF2C652|nr:hypothetical protein [Bacteroides thetaiotaomicron]MCS3260776.1 hypothetical protein [Bacteroides thetaiotaomicron]MCS3328890.1 hypothetical protein [Bacteroides thetaiotaomicron]
MIKKQLLFDGIMSALLRKDLFRVPMRPISGTDEDRLRHRPTGSSGKLLIED